MFCEPGRGGARIPRVKNPNFFSPTLPRRGKFWLFFSPTLPRRGKFWLFSRHGEELAHFGGELGHFGEELGHFGEELAHFARHDPPRRGKILLKSSPDPLGRGKFLNFPRPAPPRPNWRGKIPRPRHSPPLNFSPRRGLVLTIAFLAEAGSSSRYLLDCHFWSGHVSKKGPNTSEIWTRRLWSFGSTAWATTGAPVGWLDDDQLLQPYSILVQFPVPEFFVMSSFFSVSKDFDFFRRMFVKHAHYFSNSCKSGWLLKRFLLDDSFSGLMQPLICLEMNKPCGLSEAGLLKLLDLTDGWTDSTLILCLPW